VLRLPFADRSFGFAYSVNLFHHLGSAEQQRRAFAEIRRVLDTGALFHLHEINVTNPIFRFYMGYLFPLLRNIDRGTEQWLLPARMRDIPGMRLRRIEAFTFIPDFAPRWAVTRLRGLERRLERSRWARYGAHFVAVLERVDGA
jgi:SAM-dependent methyltransferase